MKQPEHDQHVERALLEESKQKRTDLEKCFADDCCPETGCNATYRNITEYHVMAILQDRRNTSYLFSRELPFHSFEDDQVLCVCVFCITY